MHAPRTPWLVVSLLAESPQLCGQAEGSKEEGAEEGGNSWGTDREGFLEAVALRLDLRAQGEFRHTEEWIFQMREAITAGSHW